MMNDLIFSMDLEPSGVVPDAFSVGFGSDAVTGYHDYYDVLDESRPPFHSTCQQQKEYPHTEANPCLSDSALISGNSNSWLEETRDLTEFLRHEALSPSLSGSSLGESPRLKGPMEIYREIEEEASKFSPPPASEMTGSPPTFTTLQPAGYEFGAAGSPGCPGAGGGVVPTFTISPGSDAKGSPSTFTTLQPARCDGSVASRYGAFNGAVPEDSMEQSSHEVPTYAELSAYTVNEIINAQGGYTNQSTTGILGTENTTFTAPAAVSVMQCNLIASIAVEPPKVEVVPPEPSLHVVQMLGNRIIFPDGTSAMIVKATSEGEIDGSETQGLPEDMEGVSTKKEPPEPPPKKRRTYQKSSYERKKMQNRESAYRYRQKKQAESHHQLSEYEGLLQRNSALKKDIEGLQQEISYWKKFMLEVRSKDSCGTSQL